MSFPKSRWIATFAAAAMVATFILAGVPRRANAQDSRAKDEVLAMEKQFTTACVAGDAATLNSLLADDALFIHGNGMVQTKPELIDAITTGKLAVGQYDMNDPQYIPFDGGAVLSGLVDFGFKSRPGSTSPPMVLHMRGSSVWVHHDGKWQLYLAQDTTLSGPGNH